MKRCVSIIFILCIMLVPLCADNKLWIPNSLIIGMGNDKWDIGVLSYNADDQLSFSEHIRLSAPIWSLNLNMMAISNRGWQNGWEVGNDEAIGDGIKFDGRYDVTDLSFSLNLNLLENDLLFIKLKPEIGISIVGDQGYDEIQNNFHKLLKIATLNIPYDTKGNEVKLLLNGEIESAIKLPLSSYLSLGSKIQYTSTFSTIGSFYIALGNFDNFNLSLSYTLVSSRSKWKTQEVYFEHLKGPSLGLSINSGFMKLKFYSNLLTRNGYGIISFDVLSLFEKPTWRESDIYLTFSQFKQIYSYFYDVTFSYPLDNSKLALALSIRYLADNQSFVSLEKNVSAEYKQQYRKSFNGFFAGVNYQYNNSFLPFTPYLNLKGGVLIWQVIIQRNMLINNDIRKIIYPMIYSFTLDFELGLKLFQNFTIKTKNTELKFIINVGLTLINNPKEVKSYLKDITDNSESISYFLPRIGCGVELGFDL